MAISDYIYSNFSDKPLQKYIQKIIKGCGKLDLKVWISLQFNCSFSDLIYTLLYSMMKSYETTKFKQPSVQLNSGPISGNQIPYSTFYLLQLKSFASHPKKPSSLNTNQRA